MNYEDEIHSGLMIDEKYILLNKISTNNQE